MADIKTIGAIVGGIIGFILLLIPRRTQGRGSFNNIDTLKPLDTIKSTIQYTRDPIIIGQDRIVNVDDPATQAEVRDANVSAFLNMIQWAEGMKRKSDPYAWTFAFQKKLSNFSDHPANTGEWTGYPLSDAQCAGAGFGPGCKTTAAGAYQYIRPTWNTLKNRYPSEIVDFGPTSQDNAAVRDLNEKGALDLIIEGKIQEAIIVAGGNGTVAGWASLPGNTSGQPQKSMNELIDYYLEQGGYISDIA